MMHDVAWGDFEDVRIHPKYKKIWKFVSKQFNKLKYKYAFRSKLNSNGIVEAYEILVTHISESMGVKTKCYRIKSPKLYLTIEEAIDDIRGYILIDIREMRRKRTWVVK